jgi:hypothetical protein
MPLLAFVASIAIVLVFLAQPETGGPAFWGGQYAPGLTGEGHHAEEDFTGWENHTISLM